MRRKRKEKEKKNGAQIMRRGTNAKTYGSGVEAYLANYVCALLTPTVVLG